MFEPLWNRVCNRNTNIFIPISQNDLFDYDPKNGQLTPRVTNLLQKQKKRVQKFQTFVTYSV